MKEQNKDMRVLYLLTCEHRHKFGTSIHSSVHASENEAEERVQRVMIDFEFDPDDEMEYFSYEIKPVRLDVNRLAKTPIFKEGE